jgi:EAL domain-containing protein (putative c-di-GMP-specific phosphodiesterase class I)
LSIEIVVLTLDLLGSLSTEDFVHCPQILTVTANVLYFCFYTLRTLLFFICTCYIVKIRFRRIVPLVVVSGLVFVFSELVSLSNFFYPVLFSITDGKYVNGSYYDLIYISSCYFLLASFLVTVIYRKNLTRKGFYSVLIFNLILLTGYTFRILFKNLLIMDLFCTTTLLIIYLSFENPDLFIEEKTGLFNRRAFSVYVEEISSVKSSVLMGFTIHNYGELRETYGRVQMDKGLYIIGQYMMKEFNALSSFYLGDGKFAFAGKSVSLDPVYLHEKLNRRFARVWRDGDDTELYLEIGFAAVNVKLDSVSPLKLINSLASSLNAIEKTAGSFTLIDEKKIAEGEHTQVVKRAVEKAVENNTVELFLQPLIDARSEKLIGAEALARIRDDDGKIVPPGEFIKIAEKNGRINMLGEQIFEKTCKFIKDNNIQEKGLSWINVNLSPIQLLRRDLNERFSSIIRKYDVDASLIHLEVTEEAMIDPSLLENQMSVMGASGFQFSLDDFGSGFSNFTRLKSCPFKNVKFDMSIVWDYIKNQDKILPALVKTFKEMNFTVTAEGVETRETVDSLKAVGCDYLQGYYFSKPVPCEEFLEFMKQKTTAPL